MVLCTVFIHINIHVNVILMRQKINLTLIEYYSEYNILLCDCFGESFQTSNPIA